jgi:hypothetical protein
MKTQAAWDRVREWARVNPGKTAAIVTPEGVYRVSFTNERHQEPALLLHATDEPWGPAPAPSRDEWPRRRDESGDARSRRQDPGRARFRG